MVVNRRSYTWEWLAACALFIVAAAMALFFIVLWLANARCQIGASDGDERCAWIGALIYSAEAISFGIAGFAAALTAIGAAVVAHILSSKRRTHAEEQAAAVDMQRAETARTRYLRLLRADAERLAGSYIHRAEAALFAGWQWPRRGHEESLEYEDRLARGRTYLAGLTVERPLSLSVQYLTTHDLDATIINNAIAVKAMNADYDLLRSVIGNPSGPRTADPDFSIIFSAIKAARAGLDLSNSIRECIGGDESDCVAMDDQLNSLYERAQRHFEARGEGRG